MGHTITVGGLLLGLCVLAGLVLCGAGALALFASGMSDNHEASADTERTGCMAGLFGALLLIGGVWGLFS